MQAMGFHMGEEFLDDDTDDDEDDDDEYDEYDFSDEDGYFGHIRNFGIFGQTTPPPPANALPQSANGEVTSTGKISRTRLYLILTQSRFRSKVVHDTSDSIRPIPSRQNCRAPSRQ